MLLSIPYTTKFITKKINICVDIKTCTLCHNKCDQKYNSLVSKLTFVVVLGLNNTIMWWDAHTKQNTIFIINPLDTFNMMFYLTEGLTVFTFLYTSKLIQTSKYNNKPQFCIYSFHGKQQQLQIYFFQSCHEICSILKNIRWKCVAIYVFWLKEGIYFTIL